MVEVLRMDLADDAARLVAPSPVLDPATEQLLAAAESEGRRKGRREGEAASRAAADRAMVAVADAVAGLQAELAAQRAEALRANIELAELLASAVLDASPPPDALAVLDRVRDAVAGLDDDRIEVRLHPEDHAVLTAADAPPAGARLALVADRSLKPGEARLVGEFGGAELTRAALLAAAIDVLGAGAA